MTRWERHIETGLTMAIALGGLAGVNACSRKTPPPHTAARGRAKARPATRAPTKKPARAATRTPTKKPARAATRTPTKKPVARSSRTPKTKAVAANTGRGRFKPDSLLYVCPKIKITNRPRTDRTRKILAYKPFAKVGKVNIAVAPVNGACLTSGFGTRRGKPHKGIDYQGKPAPLIHAAAAGTVREAEYRDDYGKVVLIDHGRGVFTRYAHLKYIAKGIKVGRRVSLGTVLGRMGQTSKYKVALHLHYEVLTGNYDTPKKSFGLKAIDLFRALRK